MTERARCQEANNYLSLSNCMGFLFTLFIWFDKWSSMSKSDLIGFIVILIFSLPFTYGGCSGGGGGGDGESVADDVGIDVKLPVPYVADYGNTCVTSSFTMVLKYYGTGAEFADVWNVVGYPADYDAFDSWIRNDYDLRLELLSNQIIDDIIHYIDRDKKTNQ